jgi:NAD(P)H-flavin reductase
LTEALHNLEEDKIIGFRGPYGNGFPIEELKGKNLIFIGGGIGIAALKSLILHCLDRKEDFQNLTLIYGARNVADLVYKREMEEWEEKGALKVFITVDPGGDIPGWRGKVGFVPQIVKELAPSWENSVSIICGPPIMIKFTIEVLESLNFSPTQIMTTLEMKMKCGIGKCGRCNLGNLYVCRDGPVFTYAQLQKLPQEY